MRESNLISLFAINVIGSFLRLPSGAFALPKAVHGSIARRITSPQPLVLPASIRQIWTS